MSDKKVEQVLVVPTSAFHGIGAFHGFTREVSRYLPRLLDPSRLSYLPRPAAEDDPSFKQLIPYIVLRHGDQVFHYTRGKAGGETRLRALRSIGVGGHICSDDGAVSADAYRAGMLRELEEEVELTGPWTERVVGLINDDTVPVGRVHLGIVHLLDLSGPTARRRDRALTASGFAPLAELRQRTEEFETWSQFLLAETMLGE